jgi:hypothetical protein
VRVDVAEEREDGGGRLRLRPGGDGAGRPAPRRLVPARRRRRQRQDQREQSHEHEARGRWCHVGGLASGDSGREQRAGRRQTRMGFSPCLLLPSLPFPLSLNLFFLVVWAYGWGGGFYIGEKMGPTASSVDVLFVLLEGKTKKKKGSVSWWCRGSKEQKDAMQVQGNAIPFSETFLMRCGLLHLRSIS